MAPHLIPFSQYHEYSPEDMRERACAFAAEMARRRTVRDYSPRAIPDGVLDECLRTAGSAPSGANLQPWHFVVITDPAIKQRIRAAAEAEEREFYESRATPEWLEALAPLGTDPHKPFLEVAPALIAIFGEAYGEREDGTRLKRYYVTESVGIATGLLIAALHHAGLATLTHTPSPMGFLNEILDRPARERPFLLLVVGYPAEDAQVPDITRKPLDAIVSRR
jgi:nitroreductase